jgi:SAM-dependent methyltransferase
MIDADGVHAYDAFAVDGDYPTSKPRSEPAPPAQFQDRMSDGQAGLPASEANDRLANEHSIDDYYENAPLPIRLIERRRLAVIRAFMGSAEGLDVLEIGSGGGHVLKMFPGSRITAVDVSSVFLDLARRNLEGFDVRFLLGEVQELGLGPQSFDRVICTEVLEHTVEPEVILGEIARLLRPDGIAAITVPDDHVIMGLKRGVRRVMGRRWYERRASWGGDSFHLHQWRSAEFRALLARHLHVTDERLVPSRHVPIRLCYRCIPHQASS